MNVVVDESMSFSSVGSQFHVWSAATENMRSQNRRTVENVTGLNTCSQVITALPNKVLLWMLQGYRGKA